MISYVLGTLGFNVLSLNNSSLPLSGLAASAVLLYGQSPLCGLPRRSLIDPIHIYNDVYCSHEDLGCNEYDDWNDSDVSDSWRYMGIRHNGQDTYRSTPASRHGRGSAGP